MPALSLKSIEVALSKYVRPDDDFTDVLNVVIPRIYDMGYWRDLVYEDSVVTDHAYIALPDRADSLLAATIDDYPVPANTVWNDFRIVGTHQAKGTYGIFGMVDDGYHPVKIDLNGERNYKLKVTTISGVGNVPSNGRIFVTYYDSDSVLKELTITMDGTASVISSEDDIFAIDSILYIDVNDVKITALAQGEIWNTAETYNVDFLINGSIFEDLYEANVGDTNEELTVKMAGNTYLLDDPDTSELRDDNTSFIFVFVEYAGGSVAVMTPEVSIEGGTISVEEYTPPSGPASPFPMFQMTLNKASEIAISDTNMGEVSRYRRFRLFNDHDEVRNVRLLLKRKFQPLFEDTDIEYLGNLNAIKHGILGLIAEDNADLQRAEYHWEKCVAILEKEVDSNRGNIRPTLKVDPFGGAGHRTPNLY